MTNESRRGVEGWVVAGRPREQVQRNEKTRVHRVAARVLQLETRTSQVWSMIYNERVGYGERRASNWIASN